MVTAYALIVMRVKTLRRILMDNQPKVMMRQIFYRYGKPWESRLITDYDSVRTTKYRVSAKTWHNKVINIVFARSGILTYYA